MLNKEREQEILHILKTVGGFVTVKQLCERLFASESSIRRDLKGLEKRGLVKRSYGGAVPVMNFSGIDTFTHRAREHGVRKREIGEKAAALVQEGDIIFLDQSSTCFFLAEQLMHRSTLTVVTNNIEIMMLLSQSEVTVIASGGYLSDKNRNCLIGTDAVKAFENIFADKVFFSVKSLSQNGDVTDCSLEEIGVRSAMLKNAKKKILLCDSSKFSTRAPYKQCDLKDVDILISEGDTAHAFSHILKTI